MNNDKLSNIIAEHNQELEYEATRKARALINGIASHQAAIKRLGDEIAQMRVDLKAMEIQQINTESILGS